MDTTIEMRGQLTTVEGIKRFIAAGRAIVTVQSRETGNRFTFKFKRPAELENKPRPIWVNLLSGQNNESDYTFLGTIWQRPTGLEYSHSAKSRVDQFAKSVQAIRWIAKHLNLNDTGMLEKAEFWHEGRCGKCGRLLTVPSSIETGFGPECVGKVGL